MKTFVCEILERYDQQPAGVSYLGFEAETLEDAQLMADAQIPSAPILQWFIPAVKCIMRPPGHEQPWTEP